MEREPLFSIVTVVFNDPENLEKTIRSVISQSFKNFEFIVIDGGSSDNTLTVLRKYKTYISEWVSEPDKGIYDAMNKGIARAKGKYINFLNAGDIFYEEKTLEKIHVLASNEGDLDVIYGKSLHKSNKPGQVSYIKGELITEQLLFKNVPFCHQTLFVKACLFRGLGGFDTSYKIVADYEWLIRYYNSRNSLSKLAFLDDILVEYDRGGYSFKNIKKGVLEKFKVVKAQFRGKYYYQGNLNFALDYIKVSLVVGIYRIGVLEYYRKLKYSTFQRFDY